MMRNLVLMVVLFASLGVAACNTTAGFGKDVKATGKAIENTAEDAKESM